MKNKKGFTLVELLATIILLALLMMIAVPAFNKYILKSENSYYKNLEKTLISSAKEYLNQNKMLYPKDVGDYYLVTKEELIKSGILEEIKDKDGKECIEANVYAVKEKSGKYKYVPNVKCGGYKSEKDGIDEITGATDVSDQTPPIVGIPIKEASNTNTIKVRANCQDSESGIKEYLFSNDGGATYVSAGKNYVYLFQNLESGKNYSFKVKCINGNNLAGESETTSMITASLSNPTIRLSSEDRRNNAEWAVTKTYEITNQNTDINEPIYYFKTNIDITVNNGLVKGMCGTENIPSNCIYSNQTTLKENTWYQASTNIFLLKYGKPGTLYAAIGDGLNISGISSMKIEKVDAVEPTIFAKQSLVGLGTQDYDFMSNINYTVGISGGNASCDPATTRKTGYYPVTCTVIGGNKIIKSITFSAGHSYLPEPMPCEYKTEVWAHCSTTHGPHGPDSSGNQYWICPSCPCECENAYAPNTYRSCSRTVAYCSDPNDTLIGNICYKCYMGGTLKGNTCYYED